MLKQTQDREEIIARVAALDIGKAEVMCCVRVPDPDRPGLWLQEVRPYSTMTRSLLVLADRLAGLGVSRVVMESTSYYAGRKVIVGRERTTALGVNPRTRHLTTHTSTNPAPLRSAGCFACPLTVDSRISAAK